MRRRVAAPALALAALAALAGAILAGSRGPDPGAVPDTAEVGRRVMSPFCPGLTLEECPSSQAAALRERIDSRVRTGWTNRRIDEWLVANYGEGVLARPSGASAWAVPAAALAAGGLVVAALLARSSRRGQPPPPAALGAADRDRVAADLRRYAEGGTE